MKSFHHSMALVSVVALISLAASTQGAYHTIVRSRPSFSLKTKLFPDFSAQFLSFPGVGSMMLDVNTIFGNMMSEFEDVLYQPLKMQRLMRPSFLYQEFPDTRSLALRMPTPTMEFTQDDKEIKIKMNIPGAKANDIYLQFDKDNRLLTVSGAFKREDKDGVFIHSSFQESFAMNRHIDASNISAQMESGVLVVTAPKYEHLEESVRCITIVDNDSKELNAHKVESAENSSISNAPSFPAKHDEEKTEVGTTVIDLDVNQDGA